MPPTALTSGSVRSLTMFAVSWSSDSTRRRLGMLMNWRNNWSSLDSSGTENYRHCYQRMEKASACLCLHKGPIFRTFTVSSWASGQLDKLSAKVTQIWTHVLYFNEVIIRLWIKNAIFRLSLISQVVQKQTLGEVGTQRSLNGRLMASCVGNICTKNYSNLSILLQVTIDNGGNVFETQCINTTITTTTTPITTANNNNFDFCSTGYILDWRAGTVGTVCM